MKTPCKIKLNPRSNITSLYRPFFRIHDARRSLHLLKYLIILPIVSLFFTACENDIEKINFLETSEIYPDIIGENVEAIYSDSGKVKVKMTAPELNQYSKAEKPYSEFPSGMKVIFFDDNLDVESELEADYVIYYTQEKLWHAKGNVKVRNLKTGEKLDSEELFWDEEKEEIYSNTFTRIEQKDDILYGQKGFRSDQTLKDYELIGSSGFVTIEEDE